MPRIAKKLECSIEDRKKLEKIVSSQSGELRMIRRAKIILH
jgi:hypothetical protein